MFIAWCIVGNANDLSGLQLEPVRVQEDLGLDVWVHQQPIQLQDEMFQQSSGQVFRTATMLLYSEQV